jgi:transcriptional regulatory protein LevR
MLIELPSLKERPFSERYEIITKFLSKEAFRINRTIIVKADVIRALMLYDCSGNIGQLRSDIQVACARSFLNSMKDKKIEVITRISDLPNHIRTGLLKISKREPEIEQFVNEDVIINPNNSGEMLLKEDRYILQDNIYQYIEERFTELEKEGLTTEQINKIVGNQVEVELKRFVKNIDSKGSISKKELQQIVGEKIIEVVEKVIRVGKQYFDDIQENIYYPLATHISATYSRLINGKAIINPQLEHIKTEYSKEYEVAKLMAGIISEELGVILPEDEFGFIAMYLRTFCGKKQIRKGRVGVIVLTHGHVATGMADVANRLLGVNHAVGIEMSLDESPQSALEKTIEVVKNIDEGKGCIILVDMGSLITFGEIITKKTGITTMAVGRVDTVMVLDVLRRAIIEDSNLKEIVQAVNCDKNYVGRIEGVKEINKLPKAIVTLCITGEGTALNIKKYIEDLVPETKDKVEIIPVGLMKQDNIEEEITRISEKNNILAIVGTFNPNIEDISFISFEDVIKGYGLKKIKKILGIRNENDSKFINVINEDLILNDVEANSKDEIIDRLVGLLNDKGYVDDKFMLSVYKREIMGNTCFKNNTAIPHGLPQNVVNSAIAIAKLVKPIEWEKGIKIDVVFLIALKEDGKDYFRVLNKLVLNETAMKLIRKSMNPSEIRDIIINNTK